MKTLHKFLGAALTLGASMAFAQTAAPVPAGGVAANGDNQPAPVILLVPVEVSNRALEGGCWVQFYEKKDFKGDIVTLVGPSQLAALDKGTAKQLRRDIDSIVTGPKTTLHVYEHRLFKDRKVDFAANTRDANVRKTLGFGGRIESMQIDCQ
ncbi:hypothetical protein GT347_14290 [Xylophilus rhododendri]|uniref:Beta/Gamma crystallin n=1 Tax=Xylophilus rhododendri TaxID=2697032 RepID=A0A857J507_9BURK|nr:hypothetical protein [Xylophilus rhododendri]QHI99050.1 hypothetical protein GT347_14290 [Xylophilus rhododendri]